MIRWKSILPWVAIFLLGIVAGFGIGNLYGVSSYNAQLEQKVTDLQSRFQTVNDSYFTLVREYNKLFTLKAPAVAEISTVPASPSPAAPKATISPVLASPSPAAPKATTVPAENKGTATPAAKPTNTPTAAKSTAGAPTSATTPNATGAKSKADFKALAVDGTGPLEGPPPLVVKFTDLSTGNITSWKWDFGDGQTSTDHNPEHKYEKACPGDKNLCTVKLTVCGSDGCLTATKPDYLWISESCTGC
jgi:PKD domain